MNCEQDEIAGNGDMQTDPDECRALLKLVGYSKMAIRIPKTTAVAQGITVILSTHA